MPDAWGDLSGVGDSAQEAATAVQTIDRDLTVDNDLTTDNGDDAPPF